MQHRTTHSKLNIIATLLASIVFLSLALTACSAFPAATPTPVPATDTAAPTDTVVPTSTATPEPTATLTPQPTATITNTPVPPLGLADNGLSMWCLPDGISRVNNTEVMPQGGWVSDQSNGVLSVRIPAQACTVVFTLNQPVPQGMKLQLLSATDKSVWLEASLNISTQNPAIGYAQITHANVVTHPYWQITYPFALVDSAGSQIVSGDLNFYRPYPGLCWDGSTPVPVTNYCVVTDPMEREPHPENPDYQMVVPPTPEN